MRTQHVEVERLSRNAMLVLLVIFSIGCGSIGRHVPTSGAAMRVVVFSDDAVVANTMGSLLAKNPGLRVTTTTDPWTLADTERFDVAILAHVNRQQLPDEAIVNLRRFVREGGGLIGM